MGHFSCSHMPPHPLVTSFTSRPQYLASPFFTLFFERERDLPFQPGMPRRQDIWWCYEGRLRIFKNTPSHRVRNLWQFANLRQKSTYLQRICRSGNSTTRLLDRFILSSALPLTLTFRLPVALLGGALSPKGQYPAQYWPCVI